MYRHPQPMFTIDDQNLRIYRYSASGHMGEIIALLRTIRFLRKRAVSFWRKTTYSLHHYSNVNLFNRYPRPGLSTTATAIFICSNRLTILNKQTMPKTSHAEFLYIQTRTLLLERKCLSRSQFHFKGGQFIVSESPWSLKSSSVFLRCSKWRM